MKVVRKVVTSQGPSTMEKIVEFEVKPGKKAGSKVTFKK